MCAPNLNNYEAIGRSKTTNRVSEIYCSHFSSTTVYGCTRFYDLIAIG